MASRLITCTSPTPICRAKPPRPRACPAAVRAVHSIVGSTIGRRPTETVAAPATTHKVPFDIDGLATMHGVCANHPPSKTGDAAQGVLPHQRKPCARANAHTYRSLPRTPARGGQRPPMCPSNQGTGDAQGRFRDSSFPNQTHWHRSRHAIRGIDLTVGYFAWTDAPFEPI